MYAYKEHYINGEPDTVNDVSQPERCLAGSEESKEG